METELTGEIMKLYSSGGSNCAETVLTILRNRGSIRVDREAVRMMTGFGGGVGKGRVCGAIVGSVAALGSLYGRISPSDSNEETKAKVARFTDCFLGKCPSLDCEALLSGVTKDTEEQHMRCVGIIEDAVRAFARVID